MQFIDVHDQAAFIVQAAGRGARGIYNVAGPQLPMATFLDGCAAALGCHPDLQWATTGELVAVGADPFRGVPLWIGAPGWEAANRVDSSKAVAAGLQFRPLAETITDAFAWDQQRGDDRPSTFSVADETELLTRIRQRRAN